MAESKNLGKTHISLVTGKNTKQNKDISHKFFFHLLQSPVIFIYIYLYFTKKLINSLYYSLFGVKLLARGRGCLPQEM